MINDVKKRIAVGALIFNKQNQLLIVKPTYKDHWLLVGGMVETAESLTSALKREIKEETGLDLNVGRLLCVAYGTAEGHSVNFIFDCGVVENDIEIICPAKEIAEYKFVPKEEVSRMLGPKGVRRVSSALDAREQNTTAFIEISD